MKSVFILLGPEEGEKNSFITTYIDKVKKQTGEEPEVSRVYPFETDMIDVISGLQNASLFSKFRIIILNNAEAVKQGTGLNILTDYIKNPVPNTTLMLLSESVSDVSTKLSNAVPKDCRIIFWELFENKKIEWIRNYFHNKNIRIDEEAVNLIIEMVNGNTMELKNECSRLSLFFGKDAELRADDVEKYLFHSKEENVFTLFNYIAARDLSASLEILNKILLSKESEPIGVLAGLLWQIRKLLDFKRLIDKSYSQDEAFNKINIRNKQSRKIYMEAAQKYTLSEIRSMIILINEFDERLRSVKSDLHIILLQLFVYNTVVRGGQMVRV